MPAQMSVRGISCQLEAIGRTPKGDPSEFVAFFPLDVSAPVGLPGSATYLSAVEDVAGIPHPTAGAYHSSTNPAALGFVLTNRNGVYRASIATATDTHVLIGAGNEKGRSGPDYYTLTRYFCPFNLQGAGIVSNDVNHQTCGAAIVFVHRRVDFGGYMVEVMFTGACMPAPITGLSGNVPQNPGHVIYSEIALDTGSSNSVTHMDTFTGETGPTSTKVVRAFNTSTDRHLLSPGCAPGWIFAVHLSAESPATVASILYGDRGVGIGYSGRGFHPGSSFGYGPNHIRWDSPGNWPGDSLTAAENRSINLFTTLKNRVSSGISFEGNRQGTYLGFTEQNPNATSGENIYGHGLLLPTPSFVGYLRLGAMCYSRRSNHCFFKWNSNRQILPVDALSTFFDNTLSIQANVTGCLYNCADVGAGASNAIASTQFACASPRSGKIIGLRGGNPPGNQPLNGPTTRVWNSVAGGETFGAAAEDAAEYIGYSHNLAHSARFFGAREAWLFGLSGIGLELSMGMGAWGAAYHLAWDVFPGIADWDFNRPIRNLHAWGWKDKAGIDLNQGFLCARRRGWLVPPHPYSGLGPLGTPTGDTNYGQQTVAWETIRHFGWSLVWQASAIQYGNDSWRAATIGQIDEHNPMYLAASFMGQLCTELGAHTSIGNYPGSVPPDPYSDEPFELSPGVPNPANNNGGPTNIATRMGGLPGGDNYGDSEWWTMTIVFHEAYVQLGMDAVASYVEDTSLYDGILPILLRAYFMYLSHEQNLSSGGVIGLPRWVCISRGTIGPLVAHQNANTVHNPATTEAQARAGDLWWKYIGELTPTPPGFDSGWNGYGFEISNWALGWFVSFKHMPPARYVEAVKLMNKSMGLADTAPFSAVAAFHRAQNPQLGHSLANRVTPLLGAWPVLEQTP